MDVAKPRREPTPVHLRPFSHLPFSHTCLAHARTHTRTAKDMASAKETYCSYRGWVDKLGYRVPSWKRRFLVLDGVRGFYYTSPPEVAFSSVKGSFTLGHTPTGPAGTPAISVCSIVSDLIR